MKKAGILAVALLLVAGLHSTVFAQSEYMVGAKLGYAGPTGDFGEDFDGGVLYGIFGEVAYSPYLSIEGSLVRHTHDESEQGLGELFPIHLQMAMFPGIEEEHFGGEKSLSMNELTLNAKVYLPGEGIRPYLTGGVGGYFWKLDIENLGRNTETDFGVNGGAGLLVPVGDRVYLGVDARYTYVWTQIAIDKQSLTFWNITGLLAYGF
jgi:opacity protein-like surface antigen